MSKILITGSMGVGKTTLFNDLKEINNKINKKNNKNKFTFLPEVARKMAKKGINLDKKITPEMEYSMAFTQDRMENKYDKWITDRGFVDLLAYVELLFPKDILLNNSINNYLDTAEYDIILYIPIEFKLKKDGVRSTDIKFQKQVDEKIKSILKKRKLKHHIIKGNREERLLKVKEILWKKKK